MIKPAPHSSGFSLVETLAVLVLMSVLTFLTISSMNVVRSTSLTASGNQMVDVFAMARQNAISKNAYTAVVIKSQGTSAYSAYCLLELPRKDDGSFDNWTTVTPWRYLGKGVVFESGQASDTFTTSAATLPKSLPTNFPFQGSQIDLTTTTVYQCYQPDGTLVGDQSNALRLRLISGAIDPTSGTFTYQGSTVSGNKVSYYDLVFVGNTGVTKIERP